MSRTPPTGGLHSNIDLPHAEEWELYHNGFSLCSKKLRVCMAELGTAYASHHIELIETGAYESCSPTFLKINPGGTVPVVVHRGHPVYESHDQIVYLAQHAGARGAELLPDDPEMRAIVEQWTDCASLVGDALQGTRERAGHCIPGLTLPVFAAMVQYIPYSEILKGLLTHPNKERPLLFTMMKFRGVEGILKVPPMRKMIRRSRRDMGQHLDALAAQLEKHGGPWIAGASYTLADVSWVVLLDRLVEVDWDDYFWGQGKRPAVLAYWERLKARPSYRTQVIEMRCPITRKGIEDIKRAKASDSRLLTALEGD
jgi:glutathione S-transferase